MLEYGPMKFYFPDREDWTLSGILAKQAKRYGNKPYLTEPERASYSYRQTDELASRIAAGLLDRGLQAGDRLMIYLDNCAEYVLAWFGAVRASVVEVPTNSEYFGDFLRHAVRLTGPRGIVVGARYVARFAEIDDVLRVLQPRFFVLGEQADAEIATLRKLGYEAERYDVLTAARPLERIPAQPRQQLGGIIFTSGTTGASKGVMLSHAQFYYHGEQCINLVRLTEDDVYMTGNPLFHGNAQFLTTYPTLIAGASMFLYPKFSPTRFSQRLAQTQATVTNFVGVMMDWVAKQPEAETDRQSRLRCLFSAPTAWSVADVFRKRFGVQAFTEVFGQTEICQPIMTPYGMERPAGACGLALSESFDIQLADVETDEPVAPGQVGELQIRTKEPWILNLGYFGMPEASAEARRNLWFHTGDGLRRDQDGWFYFVDRLKDCLRRRGENISSFEVEAPILGHPAVGSCAAVGLPADEEGGEDEVGVFIIPKDGATVDPAEISEWAKARMPQFIVPRYVQVVDSFPMTPSGKIQKAKLRALGSRGAWDRAKAEKSGK